MYWQTSQCHGRMINFSTIIAKGHQSQTRHNYFARVTPNVYLFRETCRITVVTLSRSKWLSLLDGKRQVAITICREGFTLLKYIIRIRDHWACLYEHYMMCCNNVLSFLIYESRRSSKIDVGEEIFANICLRSTYRKNNYSWLEKFKSEKINVRLSWKCMYIAFAIN